MLTLHRIFPIAFLLVLIVSMMLLPPRLSGATMALTVMGLLAFASTRVPTQTFKNIAKFAGEFLGLLFVVGIFSGWMALLSSMLLA
ncbi:hypothetical protein [Marinicella sp. W31]|uniref:hypothetical protein n=1 Tax=Marinicella sp. W31 TaxID=3023713 RepID=UPI003756D0E2